MKSSWPAEERQTQERDKALHCNELNYKLIQVYKFQQMKALNAWKEMQSLPWHFIFVTNKIQKPSSS